MPGRINPNRMELMKLKRRLRLARRGHKLMKDKFDELLKRFMETADESIRMRELVEESLLQGYELLSYVKASHEEGVLESLFENLPVTARVEVEETKTVGVSTVKMRGIIEGNPFVFNLPDFSLKIEDLIKHSEEVFYEVVRLAELEHNLYLIAREMERTRRRVNALEQVLIPQLEGLIKTIALKLDEIDRETRTRVMKVKEMLEAQRS